MIRAFRTELDDIVCIVYAETASKARHITRTSALDAYFTNVDYADIKVSRAKEFDNGITKDGKPIKTNHCYTPEYLALEGME